MYHQQFANVKTEEGTFRVYLQKQGKLFQWVRWPGSQLVIWAESEKRARKRLIQFFAIDTVEIVNDCRILDKDQASLQWFKALCYDKQGFDKLAFTPEQKEYIEDEILSNHTPDRRAMKALEYFQTTMLFEKPDDLMAWIKWPIRAKLNDLHRWTAKQKPGWKNERRPLWDNDYDIEITENDSVYVVSNKGKTPAMLDKEEFQRLALFVALHNNQLSVPMVAS